MEYQFENVQRYNQKLYLEFQYHQRKKVLLWAALCLGAALLDAVAACRGETWRWFFAAAFFVLAVHYSLLPYFKERQRAKAYFDFYNGENAPARVRFGDQIRIEDHSAVMTIDYDQIRQVIALKRGLFLRYQDAAYVSIDPNGFTKGTCEEFKAFLRKKRPDLNIPD